MKRIHRLSRCVAGHRLCFVLVRVFLTALVSVATLQCAFAAGTFVTKTDATIGSANPIGIIGDAAIKIGLVVGNSADKLIPIPMNRRAVGSVAAATNISGVFGTIAAMKDPPFNKNDPKPGFKIKNIYVPGLPPDLDVVGAAASSTDTTFGVITASAGADAKIEGELSADKKTVGGQTTTFALANATLNVGSAVATAGTDPFTLDPLPSEMSATLIVDFHPDDYYSANDPTARFLVAANADPDSAASASFTLNATTNISGLAELFHIAFSASALSPSQINVDFASPNASQPIFSSDFDYDPLNPGAHLLKNDKAMFQIPFTIPAGILGSDSDGSYGLALNFEQAAVVNASAPQGVPEPTSVILATVGLALLIISLSCRSLFRL